MRDRAAAQPTTTDAVLFTGVHRLAARSLPLPALGPYDLLVRTGFTALSRSHLWPVITGARAHLPGEGFPIVPGDAAIGTVIAVGVAVGPAWRGTRVFVGTACTQAGTNAARGVQQAWLVAPVDAVVRLDGLDPESALFIAPLAAALANLVQVGMAAGASLAVLGQGVPGQMVTRAARWRGAARITVADASDLHLARAVADRAVPLSLPDSDVPEIDLLVDTTGDIALVRWWSASIRPRGTLLLLGWYPRLDLAYLQGWPGDRRVLLAVEPDRAAMEAARDALAAGYVDTTGLITHRFTHDRAAQAHAVALGDPDALQVVLAWE